MKKRYYQPLFVKHLCLLFIFGTIFYACSLPTSPEEPESPWWEALLAQQDSFSKDVSPLKLSLNLSDHQISDDQSLTMTMSVRNTSEDSLIFSTSGSSQTVNYDFVVFQSDTAFVLNRFGDSIPLAGRLFPLAPGESITFEEVWELKDEAGNRVGEGIYLVFGGFLHFSYSSPPAGNSEDKTRLGPVATEMQEIVIE